MPTQNSFSVSPKILTFWIDGHTGPVTGTITKVNEVVDDVILTISTEDGDINTHVSKIGSWKSATPS